MPQELALLWREILARTDYEKCERPRAARFGLDSILGLLGRLGEPQHACPAIHVAGSKGKGSTAHFLAAGLRASGRRTGFYSSPHLSDWRERATVDGEWLDDSAWAQALQRVLDASAGDETFFDLITAAAFCLFEAAACEAMVIEVGLGGRFDSTRVLKPKACLVTSIESEHADVLGPGLAQIAWNKAGIFETGASLWVGHGLPSEALAVCQAEADALGQELHVAPPRHGSGATLQPPHQAANFALAWSVLDACADAFPGAAQALAKLNPATLVLPGRFEVVQEANTGRTVVLDTAHSVSSLTASLRLFRSRFSEQSRAVLLALRDDKDPVQLAAELRRNLGPRPATEEWWTCPAADHPRSADPRVLAAAFDASALDQVTLPGKAEVVLVTGSTYLVGALRASLLAQSSVHV